MVTKQPTRSALDSLKISCVFNIFLKHQEWYIQLHFRLDQNYPLEKGGVKHRMADCYNKISGSKKKELLAFLKTSIAQKIKENSLTVLSQDSYYLSVLLLETQAFMQ